MVPAGVLVAEGREGYLTWEEGRKNELDGFVKITTRLEGRREDSSGAGEEKREAEGGQSERHPSYYYYYLPIPIPFYLILPPIVCHHANINYNTPWTVPMQKEEGRRRRKEDYTLALPPACLITTCGEELGKALEAWDTCPLLPQFLPALPGRRRPFTPYLYSCLDCCPTACTCRGGATATLPHLPCLPLGHCHPTHRSPCPCHPGGDRLRRWRKMVITWDWGLGQCACLLPPAFGRKEEEDLDRAGCLPALPGCSWRWWVLRRADATPPRRLLPGQVEGNYPYWEKTTGRPPTPF